MEKDNKAVRVQVTGKVQGVWFRAWTVKQAEGLGLDGWVRNRIDGSVEVLAVGRAEDVEVFIGLCHEGPPNARVADVTVEQAQGITPRGFMQKPTV
jgi:acylphosphatase